MSVNLEDLYPPRPTDAPADLVKPTLSYKTRVVAVLVSLLIFLAFYMAMVLGSGYLLYLSVITDSGWFWKTLTVAASAMLFLFLLKGLFKRQRNDRSGYIEITEEEEPRLFAFIEKLCEETGAPLPLKVYLTPEVNAAVFYDSSILSLVWPVRKNLLIGLGLVNNLNLTEFKAVLAHEFGHFSQRTMKLGSYVYILNHVITDMTYGRDRWDDALAIWRGIDLRLSFFAWILTAVVWVIRLGMKGAFRVINLLNSSLSRQMEFNADLVAVKVTGSDPIVNALGRLEFADRCLNQAFADLSHATDQDLYTRDIFYHQKRAAKILRQLNKDDQLGVMPVVEGPETRLFEADGDSRPSMWSSHPPNHEREANAKRLYIEGVTDERSPWELFMEPEAVREKMTRRIYERITGDGARIEFRDPEEVQEFIDAEHEDRVFDPKYRDLYDRRIPDLRAPIDEVITEMEECDRLIEAIDGLYDDELARRVEEYHRLLDDFGLLLAAARGELGKKFEFQGETYRIADAEDLMAVREAELETAREWLNEFERRVFRLHLQAARRLDEVSEKFYLARYRAHQGLLEVSASLFHTEGGLNGLLNFLNSGAQLTIEDISNIRDNFSQAHTEFVEALQKAETIKLSTLNNVDPGTNTRDLLLKGQLIDDIPYGDSIDGEWIGEFLNSFYTAKDKLSRLLDKSTSGILAEQDRIVEALKDQKRSASNVSVISALTPSEENPPSM